MKRIRIALTMFALVCIGDNSYLKAQVGTCYSTPANACDLVYNGNFETYTSVPVNAQYNPGQLTLACPWIQANTATADYFTADCPAGNTFDVPNNVVGSELANSGNGYGGFATYFGPQPVVREYVSTGLRSQLIAGVTYTLSMWVSLGDDCQFQGEVSAAVCNSMPTAGAGTLGAVTPVCPAANIMPVTLVNNKGGWTQLTHTFMATGGEQFVIIGKFSNVNSPTAATGAGTSYNGAYVYIDDVSMTPIQNLSISATPSSVTCGGTSVLTNNYGAPINYISGPWSSPGTVSATTDPLTSTTTFLGIIEYCTGCIQIATTTVTVTPLPITVHPPPPVCPGSCVTLTASGATMYQWQPGGLSGSSVTVCPTGATTYTVTGTSGACSGTTTVLVTMAPTPTITATATPATLTPPAATTSFITTTVSGGSGFTYSWVPAATLNNPAVSNPIATPTVTTIYTVTVTNSNGCTAETTVQVTVNPQSPCTLPYDFDIPAGSNVTGVFGAASGATGQDIHISGVFTVNASFNFSSCNIVMEPNSSIEVASGATLYITGQTHIYSCDSMWDGIVLLSGSVGQFMNSSIIEDAVTAIKVNTGATATINNCVFNRNHTAVKVLSSTSGTTPVTMQGSVVTCRDLNLSPTISLNPLADQVWSNIVANQYAGINLKSPFYGYRSIYGVTATDVNNLQIGNPASPIIFNGFDTLMAAGIHLTRTNAVIQNNKFRHINSTLNPCGLCTPLIGTGIYAIGTTTTAYSVKVGGSLANQPNEFFNVNTSVDILRYTTNLVLFNAILNTSSTVATWGGYGKFGIRITPSANNTVTVTNNSITNAATGILVNRSIATTPQTVSLTINDNRVVANASGFCNTGISLTDPSATVTLNGTVHEINYNTVTEAGTCINLLNVKNKMVVSFNSVTTRYHATANINGIKLSNCATVDVLNNHTKSTVTGTNINSYGIYLLNSASNTVRCNTMEHATRCLVFSGNCLSPSAYSQNTMKNAQDGIVILSGATIGIQGNSTNGSDNYWELSTVVCEIWNGSGSQTFYKNAVAPAGLSTLPAICGTGSVTVLSASVTPTFCSGVPPRLAAPEPETQSTQTEEYVASILVFPNPNSGQFSINTSTTDVKDVFVYDMNGRIVYSNIQTTETILSIDITSEAKGLYLVKVVNGENVQTEKISNQ